MKRFYSVVAVGLVAISASVGGVIASGSAGDQTPPEAARVVQSSDVIGNAQPGIDLRGRDVTPAVSGQALSAQPGVPQPQPQPAARSAETTAPAGSLVANVQPGVEIRGFETQPTVEAQALSAQPGATVPQAHTRPSETSERDWTALAFAAAYDRCATESLAELIEAGDA